MKQKNIHFHIIDFCKECSTINYQNVDGINSLPLASNYSASLETAIIFFFLTAFIYLFRERETHTLHQHTAADTVRVH